MIGEKDSGLGSCSAGQGNTCAACGDRALPITEGLVEGRNATAICFSLSPESCSLSPAFHAPLIYHLFPITAFFLLLRSRKKAIAIFTKFQPMPLMNAAS